MILLLIPTLTHIAVIARPHVVKGSVAPSSSSPSIPSPVTAAAAASVATTPSAAITVPRRSVPSTACSISTLKAATGSTRAARSSDFVVVVAAPILSEGSVSAVVVLVRSFEVIVNEILAIAIGLAFGFYPQLDLFTNCCLEDEWVINTC